MSCVTDSLERANLHIQRMVEINNGDIFALIRLLDKGRGVVRSGVGIIRTTNSANHQSQRHLESESLVDGQFDVVVFSPNSC